MELRSIVTMMIMINMIGVLVSIDSYSSAFAQLFVSELTGENQPIPTNTIAVGNMTLQGNNQTLQYDLHAENLANVRHVGIHQGESDEHGRVVVSLFVTNNPNGVPIVDLVGNITQEDLKGPMADATINDLIGNMTEENNYVNIQTSEFPLGEIRGQLSLQDNEESDN